MTKFLTLIQNCLVSIFVFGFVFVSVYVPQPINKVPAAEASGWPVADFLVGILQGIGNLYTAASNALQDLLVNKELVLDGIMFALAKAAVAIITKSIVEWANRGFEGSPAFVQDLKANLLSVADNEFMLFMEEAGKPLSFLCSPFAFDIQLALTISYNQSRDRLPAACTLTGALENIENFIDGDFSKGGWDAWFQIVNQPQTYTPYGSYLEAEAQMNNRIAFGQKEFNTQVNWGKGFMSKKVCEGVVGQAGPEQNCKIVTPGDTISESLTFHLQSGSRTLIEADEVNELIGTLLGQLAQAAITGAGGLLGLSENGSGSSGGSYLDDLGNEGFNLDNITDSVNSSLATEESYRSEALLYARLLAEFAASTSTTYSQTQRNRALAESNNIIQNLIPDIDANITELTAILSLINSAPPNPDSNFIQSITQRYSALRPRLHSEAQVSGSILQWRAMLDPRLD